MRARARERGAQGWWWVRASGWSGDGRRGVVWQFGGVANLPESGGGKYLEVHVICKIWQSRIKDNSLVTLRARNHERVYCTWTPALALTRGRYAFRS